MDRELFVHKEWLGLIQPVGLVVTARSLQRAQAIPDRAIATELQPILRGLIDDDGIVQDFRAFTEQILGWEESDLVDASEGVEVYLENYSETLKPTYAVPNPEGEGWLMLVQQTEMGIGLDDKVAQGWEATPQQKFERLLRGSKVPVGLLSNGKELRLVYAPEGESSGHLTFSLAAMTEVAGRSLLSA